MKQLAPLLFVLAAIAGCGFQPAYAPVGFQASSGSIEIQQIDGRSGHFLRKALVRELSAGLPGVEEGSLKVSLRERLARLPLQVEGSAVRSDFTASGRYVLDTGDTAISGDVEVVASFDDTSAPFSDATAQQDAAERAMDLLAQRMTADMRVKLADAAS